MAGFRLRTDSTPDQLLKELLLSPLIYLRLAGILFSIIVFGCISDAVQVELGGGSQLCFYDFNPDPDNAFRNNNPCNFGIAIGVIAFLMCLLFLIKDFLSVLMDFSDVMQIKGIITLVDAIANGVWAFMWFVCFCYLADQRRRTLSPLPSSSALNCANSGVAFSFFSIFVWVAIVVINVIVLLRIHKGTGGYGTGGGGGNQGRGYASFPDEQGAPSKNEGGDDTPYSPPEY